MLSVKLSEIGSDKEKVKKAVEIVKAFSETIRELKEVPSGELYARVMSYMSLDHYNQIIGILKNAGIVKEVNNVLIWNVK